MAGAAAGVAGGRVKQSDSRPTQESQVDEYEKSVAESKRRQNRQEAKTEQQITQSRLNGPIGIFARPVALEEKQRRAKEQAAKTKEQQEESSVRAKSLQMAAAGPGGMVAGAAYKGAYDFKSSATGALKTIWNLPKPVLVAGAGIGGAVASAGLRGIGSVASRTGTAATSVKVDGIFPVFLLAVLFHVYDVRYGFPRGGQTQFGAIIGLYAALSVLLIAWKGVPIKDAMPWIIAQIVVPWGLQAALINPTFSFLHFWRETSVWIMVLFTPIIWYILSVSSKEDTIMKWMNFGYVAFLSLLLVPVGITFINDTFGTGGTTTIAAEVTAKEIVSQWWGNTMTFANGALNFIPNLIKGSTEPFEEAPPPGSGIGAAQQIGLTPTDEDQIFRSGTTQRANILLRVESADRTTYKFETYCRAASDRDKNIEKDSDDDGFVDIQHWTKIGETPRLASSRTIYCSIDPRSYDEGGTRDNVEMQFLVKYDVKVVGSYTTYFIEEYVDADNILQSNYEGEADFFRRNFGLDQAPLSEATQSPCFMSIDTNQIRPPIGVRSDDPLYTVPLVIGFTSQGFYGDTIIDSINNLEIEAPHGVTDMVCEGDPTIVQKTPLADGRMKFTLAQNYPLHGKKIRLDCEATVDVNPSNPNHLIWSGDYAQATFRVTATCNMLNQNKINARLVSPVSGSGYGVSFSRWPIEGPVTSCYGIRDDPTTSEYDEEWHEGVDIAGTEEVQAVEAGTVARVCDNGINRHTSDSCSDTAGYGIVVIIDHTGEFYTFYAHLSGTLPDIVPGYKITAGEVIGYAGCTGKCTDVHLHLGIANKDGKLNKAGSINDGRDPLCYLPRTSQGGSTWTGVCDEPKGCKPRAGGIPGQEGEVLARFASELGIPQNNAMAIALTETGGEHWDEDENVKIGDDGNSYGMMQIYVPAHPECAGVIQGTSCKGAVTCAGKTLDDLSCNVEVGLRHLKGLYGSSCGAFTGWEAAAGNYNGCCASGCIIYLPEYRKNGGTP